MLYNEIMVFIESEESQNVYMHSKLSSGPISVNISLSVVSKNDPFNSQNK